jgi:hypothetical protein
LTVLPLADSLTNLDMQHLGVWLNQRCVCVPVVFCASGDWRPGRSPEQALGYLCRELQKLFFSTTEFIGPSAPHPLEPPPANDAWVRHFGLVVDNEGEIKHGLRMLGRHLRRRVGLRVGPLQELQFVGKAIVHCQSGGQAVDFCGVLNGFHDPERLFVLPDADDLLLSDNTGVQPNEVLR